MGSLIRRDGMKHMLETSLYSPVKRFLEGLGFAVKGEIGGCDLLALSPASPPIVVVCELKLQFNLELVLQGVDRMAASDEVWLAARMSSAARAAKATSGSAICAGGSASGCSASAPTTRCTCCSARRRRRRAAIRAGARGWSTSIAAARAIRSPAAARAGRS